mmetsp:Transcript_18910/g.22638  ORF Transcript_18910/g.22638 Transcript_18910/m.22638 type:complete len:89 (+) Transcript_18910:103-369(+)
MVIKTRRLHLKHVTLSNQGSSLHLLGLTIDMGDHHIARFRTCNGMKRGDHPWYDKWTAIHTHDKHAQMSISSRMREDEVCVRDTTGAR